MLILCLLDQEVHAWESDAPPSSSSHHFFLRGFAMLSESGDTPAGQPPCKGFMVNMYFVRIYALSYPTYFKEQANKVLYGFSSTAQPPPDLPCFFLP